jgi:phosphoadenosine phosphosulfate reductase
MTSATAKPETEAQQLERLCAQYGHLDGGKLLLPMIKIEFGGRIALASSMGNESAVMLSMVAEIDQATPVIFLQTGCLFAETLAYRDQLRSQLGLTDLRDIGPEYAGLDVATPGHALWNTAACRHLRKVLPMTRALSGFDAWITGRKRIHGDGRAELPLFEIENGQVKINPLARWSAEMIANYCGSRGLPRHPLEAEGYTSIGCVPCTREPAPGEGPRGGRWADSDKTECGIHNAKWFRAGENI